jgi:hypothetical protein
MDQKPHIWDNYPCGQFELDSIKIITHPNFYSSTPIKQKPVKRKWISKLNIKLDGNINQYKNMSYDLRFQKNVKILLWIDISNDNFI